MKMCQIASVLAALALLCGAGAATAAVSCRMPNGKTIELKTATQCPPDADQLDDAGRVLRPARRAPAAPAQAPVRRVAPPVVVAPAPPPARSAFDVATAFCTLVRGTPDASECRVNSNILSASTVDVTVTGGVGGRRAWADCVQVAQTLREQARRSFAEREWRLRYFSPFSGDRPIATCDI